MSSEKNDVPVWEQRFRAARLSLPEWADDAPDRSLYISNATGTFEVYVWDRAADTHRRATDRPHGTTDAALSPDGEWIWWFDDTDGDEFGVWRRQPFAGGPDEEAVPGLAPSYEAGLALGRDGTVVVGRSTDNDGTTLHLLRPGAAQPVEIYRHAEYGGVGDLSHDCALLAIDHTEHGDAMHRAIRVVRTADGAAVAELDEVTGRQDPRGLACLGFAPVPGDSRLLVAHQRRGRWEPMLWDPLTGTETELELRTADGAELPGDVSAQWHPDARALLVEHEFEARSELFRYDLADGTLTRLDTPRGTVAGATARPDGTVEFLWSSAAEPAAVRSTAGTVVLRAPGSVPPGSVPVEDVWVDSPGGRVHALVQRPAGDGPFPTVFEVHGGPTHHDSDSFAAGPAAWLDHGFAVVRVNYRGSTGYGQAWTDALRERVGLIELEDIGAVRAWAVASGLADPARLVLSGGSWGGYLTLLGLGVQPGHWALGLAAVPVADYLTAYADEMEALKSLDRTLFGGTPEEVPERWLASSPLTYVEQVKVPVYVSAGVNDPRCPIRQIENYVTRLEQLGTPHEVYRYDAGHGSLVVEERIKQLRLEIDFVRRHLPR
ncbi:dipeptidyl aminopeptidase/acylaminoacyl peptidase [Kitasatospora sp. MAP12-15]|uniref:S9 family peptidase n=1 Tax=unclassified Kitasatospora TaxID=2633591 RepID=UPI0024748DB7|nr:prolyl oligopeptidase family serine peptidase [Kitasatospora sp. MAP12-44]MDH6111571.1 dipeptidyl aminopeptidase/acylaminoacyl peptidase [Kitasatospora sp. MAP12-44]